MAKRSRVENLTTGIFMDYYAAKQAVDDWCACGWVVEGVSVRSLNPEESRMARFEQAKKAEPFALAEISGLKFSPPKTTKYRAPREAYEAMEFPLVGLKCRWPRTEVAC